VSLSSALALAASALTNTQYQIATVSTNIANASTPGATQETYTPTPDGLGQALTTGTVTRLTNAYLSSTVNQSAGANGASSVVNSYLSSYDDALGSTSNEDDISSLLASLQSTLTTLQSDPSASSDQTAVVSAASTIATSITSLSSSIQALRTQASDNIGTTVTSINTDLQSLQTLNTAIENGTAAGTDVSALEDQRDETLTDLSSLIGVQYYTNSSNQMVVYDEGGDQLLGATAATLSYSTTSTLGSAVSYPDGISGIMLNGTDITDSISGGVLGGLIQLRDTTLPEQQDQLDQLATSLITTANAASNAGSAYPPPNSLTSSSTTTVSASDSFTGSGSITLSVTNSSGTVVSTETVSLAGITSVSDLVSAINSGAAGTSTSGTSGLTASISNGQLVIAAKSSSNGVAINGSGSSAGSDDESFSDYFGFNDIFTGADATDIAISSTLAANPATLPTGTLDASATAGSAGVAPGDSSTITSLLSALTATQTLPTTGTASSTSTSLIAAASNFVANAASVISNASTTADNDSTTFTAAQTALSNATGVDTDQQTSLLTQYQDQYEAAAQLISAVQSMYSSLISMMQG
jgi:flagellar hook-associated protein 1 FlgK